MVALEEFEGLWVWRDERLAKMLKWYYEVALNKKPAKYLICSKIACNSNIKDLGYEELWREHDELGKEFDELFKKVKEEGFDISNLESPKQSFLDLKVEIVKRMVRRCEFCEWRCKVDRVKGEKLGTCQLDLTSRVSSYFHHNGEELPIRGARGSGTIFFTSCNLRCVFCQNGDISRDKYNGIVINSKELAEIMKKLRLEGCHNINLVGGEPTPHLHTIIEAISYLPNSKFEHDVKGRLLAVSSDFGLYSKDVDNAYYNGMFNAPILFNSNLYLSKEGLKLIWELVDIWLPDFKYGNDKCALRLSKVPRYFEVVSRNHKLIYDAGQDMVIRHLIMPNHIDCCTKPVLDWISSNIPEALVNVMDQYHPDYLAAYDERYRDIGRYPENDEILEAWKYAKSLGLNFEAITFEKMVRRYMASL
jgi:putative pyruvate formate lyase activating enzyme